MERASLFLAHSTHQGHREALFALGEERQEQLEADVRLSWGQPLPEATILSR